MFRRHRPFPPIETSPFAANPLVVSVLRENVSLRDGRAVIPLWPHWPGLLADAHTFGRVLSISQNTHAVLGRITPYPRVRSASCGHCARSEDGAMEFYFARWNRAFVTVGEADGRWLYAVEFQDAGGGTLHKICLTEDSDFEAFREWVEASQAGSLENLDEPGRRGPACGAAPALDGDRIPLDPAALRHLFGSLIDARRAAHVVAGNEGCVQGAELRPEKSRESGQWIFVGGEACGLHLRHGRLAEVCLQRVHWREDVWVLKACEPEGRLACVIAPPYDIDGSAWDKFLLRHTAAFRVGA